jgi:hypothetical protein
MLSLISTIFHKNSKVSIPLILSIILLTARIGAGSFFVSASDITTSSIATAVNNERSQRNLTTLNYNSSLAQAAQYKAQDMIDNNYFSHTDPKGNYIWSTDAADGYTPYTTLGENLAINFSDTTSLMSAWIDSPEHRQNILNPAFQDQGVGVSTGDKSKNQFDITIANEFGAQPAKVVAPVVPPAPAKIVTPAPAKTITKSTAKTTTPKNTSVSVSKTPIKNNTTTVAPTQNTPAQSPASQPVQTALLPTLITSTSGLSQAQVDTSSMTVVPSIKNNQLDLHIAFKIIGTASTISGTVLGSAIQFTNNGQGAYSGDVILDKFDNYQLENLTITVSDMDKNESDVLIPLKNYPLPAKEDPKSISSLKQQVKNPDIYNLYKYIIYGFALLFALIVVTESIFSRRTKRLKQLLENSNSWNLPMVILAVGIFLSISWWH